ncbi:MAG: biotin/lipoyl-binding protein [Clostridiaceae bacterium]|nr:biotin/lipoyl-binding protein [Clostridiaceae bacterium]
MQKKKKNKKVIVLCSVLAVAVLAVTAYMLFKPEEKLAVSTVQVTKQTINETLDTTGTVSTASEKSFTLIDKVKVKTVNVKEGDTVKAGDVLATFDVSSLEAALTEKENNYEKALAAYNKAKNASSSASKKITSTKKEIAELEAQIEKLKTESQTTTAAAASTEKKDPGVKVSDDLVKRFIKVAKRFGVEYNEETARKVLSSLLSAGSTGSDISGLLDNLSTIAGSNGSFDMTALAQMGGSSGALINAEMSLVQLKAQLATLELQSDDNYISIYKTVYENAQEEYQKALTQTNEMKKGWIADQKGLVSEVNIQVGETVETKTVVDGKNVDISSIISSISSGMDVSNMISAFFGSEKVGIKVLNYPLVADISLSKYDVLDVSVNQEVTVKSADNTVHEGKVSYVGAIATSSGSSLDISSIMSGSGNTNTIPAQVTIEDGDKSFIVGTDVDISIITDTQENALVVPVEAIVIDGSEVYVYVYDSEKSQAVRKEVTLGIANDTYYQVLSGVNEGDVLIKNTSGLEDGVKVKLK